MPHWPTNVQAVVIEYAVEPLKFPLPEMRMYLHVLDKPIKMMRDGGAWTTMEVLTSPKLCRPGDKLNSRCCSGRIKRQAKEQSFQAKQRCQEMEAEVTRNPRGGYDLTALV
ncbi:hypothetical protein MLD38_035374 [Melastoma candidum]|uniref:Uncharacterized protein n=1 Tax=Melastoma candidum TaxID=119954 RepID=A0ACB9LGT0_9MYRT|nr:hypothetical protein MLD38_035374 [Melastoma candidum]